MRSHFLVIAYDHSCEWKSYGAEPGVFLELRCWNEFFANSTQFGGTCDESQQEIEEEDEVTSDHRIRVQEWT
jgi:hypothetical protein